MMAPLQEAQDDALLAEQLQSMLKPARGPAPKLSHICAAVILARDGPHLERLAVVLLAYHKVHAIASLSSQNACGLCSMLRSHLHYRCRLLHQ